jgi:hypothetical protein
VTTDFGAIRGEFARRTFRRVLLEAAILTTLLVILLSGVIHGVPGWLSPVIGGGGLLYILGGLALYPKARSAAESFHVKLLEESLTFSGSNSGVRYSDLAVAKVKRDAGKVVEIELRSAFRQTIKLRGLERMDELYELLESRIRENSQR